MNAIPIIFDFNAGWSASFIRFNKVEVSSGRSGGKNQKFRIRFDAGRFPGVSIIEPAPEWSVYSNLGFKVLSDHSNNMDLYVRIHDI